LIPLIKDLIRTANRTAHEADAKSKMSEEDSTSSLNTITAANKTSTDTKKEADDILEEAKNLLSNLTTFIEKEIAETNRDIADIDTNIQKYKAIAITDSEQVQKAKDASTEAFNSISSAHSELMKAMRDVDELLNEIEDLGEIDIDKLEDAERAMKAFDAKISGKITTDITVLQKKVTEQERQITVYTDDLTELIKQVDHTENIFNAMPQTCFKVRTEFEGNPENPNNSGS